MCSVTAYTNVVKLGTVLELPYLFRDYEHWQKSVDGKPGQLITEAALPLGLRILGYQVGGWRQTYGNKQIKTLADFRGFKLRVMQVTAYTELFKAFGAIPTPMSWQEVYLALQQKTIDGAETALPSMFTAKQYEVVKYVTLTDHAQSTVAIVFSDAKWKTLPANVQQILTQVGKEAAAYELEEWKKQDADVINQLKGKGLTIDTIDKAPLQDIAKNQVFPTLVTDSAQKSLLNEVLNMK
jgi:tripartite ATP-independent transporter DctP family solute receptor